MPDPKVTSIERQSSLVVVHVEVERLEENSLATVRADVSAAGAESPQLPVVLDLAKVSFMPSLSLGALVQLTRQFKARNQRLVLIGLQPFVRETMAITRLDRLFEIHSDLSALTAEGGG